MVLPYLVGGYFARSAIGLHQTVRVDPQQTGFLTGVEGYFDLDGVAEREAARVDLHHHGIVSAMEGSAELELLADSDVPVFHSPSIPFLR